MKDLDWNQIRAFHATARDGSLSAAARRLGLTQPTLSRQVGALEAALGVTLFDRVGRRLVLTESGRSLLDPVQAMGTAANGLALAATGRADAIAGRVSLSVTDSYAAYVLPDIVARLRTEWPQITLAITVTNSFSDLQQREADIAVRHAAPAQSGLIGRHLRDTAAHFYAARDWVARHGAPVALADLARPGVLIGIDDTRRFTAYLRGIGLAVEEAGFGLLSDNMVAVWEMVRRGLGVAPMLREVAERTPEVVRLLPDLPPIPVPVWLVTHREMRTSRRIRLVHDVLAEALSRV